MHIQYNDDVKLCILYFIFDDHWNTYYRNIAFRRFIVQIIYFLIKYFKSYLFRTTQYFIVNNIVDTFLF